MHMESSMLPPPEFARLAMPHGTTTVIIDPHEIANVAGVAGVRYMLDAAEGLPLRVRVAVPSCVPATHMETAGATLGPDEIRELLEDPRVVSLGEMMNFPGVIFGAPDVLGKVAIGHARQVDGHAPGVTGKPLQAYASCRITSDHESTTIEEARAKLEAGIRVFIREGTAARNLEALLPLVNEGNKHRFCFCTDDRHPQDIMAEGHIDHVVRRAIGLGLDPITAIQMATWFTADHFRLRDVGAVAPGFVADFVVVRDLEAFQIDSVYASGRCIARDGQYLDEAPARRIDAPLQSVRLAPSLSADSFAICTGSSDPVQVRIIEMQEHQLTTGSAIVEMSPRDGRLDADLERDLLKLAVIERHRASGDVGLGFVRGFGLQRGALASTVGHDSHNLAVLGTNDADMLLAARTLEQVQGGQVVVDDGTVLAVLPLPIAGLMSDEPAETLVARQQALYDAYRTLGSPLDDPFMTLSFMPLAVIPSLKLTDQGLVDVDAFEIVDLVVA
jgi:adenine deaminase